MRKPGTRLSPPTKPLLVVVATACLFGAAASSSAAAPIYTDWSAPVNVGPTINTASTEAGPALAGDGLSLYFYSGRSGGVGGDDIWVAQRASASDAWGPAADLGATVNSTANDSVPAFSTDGHWMFFASTRPGGFGSTDLYQAYRSDVHDDFGWQTPVHLGAGVNTPSVESGNGYFDNGGAPELFFGSDRAGGAGGTDLYVSNLQPDGSWGAAARVPELSSSGNDNRPNIRADGLEIFFYSDRAGGSGGNDLWTATRATVESAWSTPVNLGATVNSSAPDMHASLSADATTLIFSSGRPGGFGSTDLYVTTRTQILPTTKNDCKKDGWERFGVFTNQGDCVSFVATGGRNLPG